VHSLEDAIKAAAAADYKEAFIIGGGEILKKRCLLLIRSISHALMLNWKAMLFSGLHLIDGKKRLVIMERRQNKIVYPGCI
jgi:dihydrofolate reductase